MADIVTRDPFDVMNQTRQVLSRMNDMFSREFFNDGLEEGTLPLDIYEAGDELVVEASVPGFRKEDIAVRLHQGLLSIVAQYAGVQETQLRDGTAAVRYFRRERPWGAWTRRVALPGIVQDAEVRAELKDGVLKLHIPIPEAAKPKQIQIEG